MIKKFFSVKSSNQAYAASDEFLNELVSFAKLKKGWDSGSGDAISMGVIYRAINLYFRIKSPVYEYECTPFSNNSIQLTVCLKEHFLDILVKDGSYDISYEIGIGYNFESVMQKQDVSINEIFNTLSLIKEKCFSLEPLTSQSTVRENAGSTIVLQTMEMVSPYFRVNVPSRKAELCATI